MWLEALRTACGAPSAEPLPVARDGSSEASAEVDAAVREKRRSLPDRWAMRSQGSVESGLGLARMSSTGDGPPRDKQKRRSLPQVLMDKGGGLLTTGIRRLVSKSKMRWQKDGCVAVMQRSCNSQMRWQKDGCLSMAPCARACREEKSAVHATRGQCGRRRAVPHCAASTST